MPEEITDWEESPDMPVAVAEEPAPVTPTEPVTAAPEAPEAAESDDEADEPPDTGRHKNGRWRKRAGSDRAFPKDVPRIQKLTWQVRELERQLQAQKAESKPVAAPAPALSPNPGEFSEVEPTIEQFADQDDPYGAHQRALGAHDRKKENHTAKAEQHQRDQQQVQQQTARFWDGVRQEHLNRLNTAVAADPTAGEALQSVRVDVKRDSLLDIAIQVDKQSADVAIFLARHPVILDRLALSTEGKPVTESNVAIVQRLFAEEMTAASSGSVVTPPPVLPRAPVPPNPLRTAPMTTEAKVPTDDSSLEEHEAAYHQRGRRRR